MKQSDAVPVAVIGAGNMGFNHIRVYDELPEAELVEVVEPDSERRAKINEKYDVKVIDSVNEINEAIAASVAVPNQLHREVAVKVIENGLDLLIEKPLAPSIEDAKAIVTTAKKHDAILQVGHIERFNPAIQKLSEIIEGEQIIALEAHRLGPFNEHLQRESVVFDLMIHDIDIINSLVPSNVMHFDAVGVSSRSDALDHAVSHMQFKNDILGTATASHVTHGKVRTLDVTTQDAYINIDYQRQSIQIQRREFESLTQLDKYSGYKTETITEKPFVRKEEPLKLELEHFLSCVLKQNKPKIDGEQGLRAVEFASEVVEQITKNNK